MDFYGSIIGRSLVMVSWITEMHLAPLSQSLAPQLFSVYQDTQKLWKVARYN